MSIEMPLDFRSSTYRTDRTYTESEENNGSGSHQPVSGTERQTKISIQLINPDIVNPERFVGFKMIGLDNQFELIDRFVPF